MNFVIGLIMWGGLIAGPGYYLYCKVFSGTMVLESQIRPQGEGYLPAVVSLDPGMNPLRLHVGGRTETGVGQFGWVRVALLDGREKLSEGSITLNEKDDTAGTKKDMALEPFTVPRADRYTLQYTLPKPGTTKRVYDPYLRIYRNVKVPDMKMFLWGLGFFIVGLLFGGGRSTEQ